MRHGEGSGHTQVGTATPGAPMGAGGAAWGAVAAGRDPWGVHLGAFWGAPRLPLTPSSTGSTQGTLLGGWHPWVWVPRAGCWHGATWLLAPLTPGVMGLEFLASWWLDYGHGALPALWPAGWPVASTASTATALAGAGVPCCGVAGTRPPPRALHQDPQQLTLFILPAPGSWGHGDPQFGGH